MKVIDLLNRIANGEEVPNKFKFDDDIFYKRSSKCYRCDETQKIFEECFILEDLDKEIEIIEEKLKPLEDLNLTRIDINKEGQVYGVTKKEIILDIQTLQHWVNKTIDAINEMRKDK